MIEPVLQGTIKQRVKENRTKRGNSDVLTINHSQNV